MRIRNPRQYFFDILTELTGIKGGLAVSQNKLLDILRANAETVDGDFLILGGSTGWWEGAATDEISIRAEELEASFIIVMHGIGAIPDRKSPSKLVFDFAQQNAERILGRPPEDLIELVQLSSQIGMEIAFAEIGSKETSVELRRIPGFVELYQTYGQRYILSDSMPAHRRWDGILSLNDLFEGEVVPPGTTEGAYFDQRFIEYLNQQYKDLTLIQWRQFEYLVAEYFNRNGYNVKIGQGRKDGGVDIIATREDQVSGPEAIAIQCRRYGDTNPVGLDAVRAFWATIGDKGVTKGIIATTSRLTGGARSYCDARQYRISVAENERIRNWLNNMRETD